MSHETDNVEILRRAYSEWAASKGDCSVWLDILADKVDWGSIADGKPGMEFTRPRATKHEVIEYFAGLASEWDMEFYIINEFVAQGDRVVALGECSWTHKRTGKTAAVPKVDVWLFRDGKAAQFMEFFDTHAAIQATQD